MRHPALALWALLCVATSLACASAQQPEAPFNRPWAGMGEAARQLVQRLAAEPRHDLPALVVGTYRGGIKAHLLDGTRGWFYPSQAQLRAVLAGHVVVVQGAGRFVALAASTGETLWALPSEQRILKSAGSDGRVTLLCVGVPGGAANELIAVARDGSVVLERATGETVGAVAVQAGVGLVPWGAHTLSALDLASGEELLRVREPVVVERTWSLGGLIAFGDSAMVLLDEAVTTGAAQVLDLDVTKFVAPSAPTARGGREGSATQTTTYALPILRQGRLSLDGDQVVVGARQLFVGVERASGTPLWVQLLREAPLAVTPIRGGLVACDSGGGLSWVDHRGRRADQVVFDARLTACATQVGNARWPVLQPARPIEEQVVQALSVSGRRPAELDQWLLHRFGQLEPPAVTRALIELAQDSGLSPVLASMADELLSHRSNGVEHMLQALRLHYDFLSGVLQPPPVGALADALARLGVERAAPLLAEHLNDPANSPNAVRRAALALDKLATSDQADELGTFFSLYRATADDPELVAAVISVARALLRVGGAEGQRAVAGAAKDSLTQPEVQRGLRTLAERTPPP